MTQKDWVKRMLLQGFIVTPESARQGFNIYRLGSIIHRLKQELNDEWELMNIQNDDKHPDGSPHKKVNYGEYILIKKELTLF